MRSFLVTSALCCFLSPVALVQQPAIKHSNENAQGKVAQAAKQNTTPPTVAPASLPSKPQATTEKNESGAPPNDRVYKVDVVSQPRDPLFTIYVGLTAAAVLVGIVTAIAVWRQMRANEVAAQAAGRNSQSVMDAERAWMIGNPEFNNFTRPPATNEYILYPVSFENVGKSPALLLEAGVSLKMTDSLENLREPTYVPEEVVKFEQLLLVPQDSFALTALPLQITEAQYFAMRRREIFLYGHCFVKYRDIFGQEHETAFCHYYRVPWANEPTTEGFTRCIAAPTEYNKAT